MELFLERLRNNKAALVGLLVILVAIFVTVYALNQPTQTKENASQVTNLNVGGDGIGKTNNQDGTMGSVSYVGNYSEKLPKNQTGTMILTFSDPPSLPNNIDEATASANSIDSLVIQVKKVEVNLTTLASNSQGVDHWETLNIPSPMSVDLAELQKGAIVSLGQTELASGSYTEMRIYIQNATAVLSDGSSIKLAIAGKDNIIRLIKSFRVSSGQNTTVVVDFNAQASVQKSGKQYLLKPVVSNFITTK